MEFWGVEVKSGAAHWVDPGDGYIVHISLMALGKKGNNENESVQMFVKYDDQKLLIGNLSHDKFPQLATEIVLEKPFELSHTWKNGSVFFTGYKVDATESEDEEPVAGNEQAVARSGARQVNFQLPNEGTKAKQDDDEDSDEDSEDESDDDTSSEEESGDKKEKKVAAEDDSDDDDDEDDSSDEETPKKAQEESKKRPTEATTSKGSTSNKKAKFVTPQKTETKKPHVHVSTPHPSKGVKTSGSNGEASKQQQTPKSAGAFGCSSCNRSFNSEMGLQSHTKAKHSAAT